VIVRNETNLKNDLDDKALFNDQGFRTKGTSSQCGEFRNFRRNWDHRLAESDCWNIYLLAHLTEVIPIIV